MLTIIYIPIHSFNIVYKTQDLKSPDFQKRYETIIAGLKTSGPLWYQFICVFYFRRAVYSGIFVLFQDSPGFQIICANVVTIAMLLYLIIVKPYDSYLSIGLSIINEILLVWMITPTFRFLNPVITPALSKMMGNMFVGIIVATIVINWVSIIVYGVSMVIK